MRMVGGYGLDTTNNTCILCEEGEYSDGSDVCNECPEMTYQDQVGQASCKLCNSICSTCNKETGKCLTCDAGYGFYEMAKSLYPVIRKLLKK